jgi:hypothetical protein
MYIFYTTQHNAVFSSTVWSLNISSTFVQQGPLILNFFGISSRIKRGLIDILAKKPLEKCFKMFRFAREVFKKLKWPLKTCFSKYANNAEFVADLKFVEVIYWKRFFQKLQAKNLEKRVKNRKAYKFTYKFSCNFYRRILNSLQRG